MDEQTRAQVQRFVDRESLPASYLGLAERWLLPLSDWLEGRCATSDKALLVGVNGAQGSGKSTMCGALRLFLAAKGISVQVLSLDDFYLSKSERVQLAEQVHQLFATRGVPGTHDIELLNTTLDQLLLGKSVPLPVFDKAQDDRLAASHWPQSEAAVDLVLLEGWCVGAVPSSAEELVEPINQLEAEEDSDGRWRTAVNACLAGTYAQLFNRLDALVMMKVPSMEQVAQWRALQEQKRALARGDEAAMSSTQVVRFIQYFERLTLRALEEMPQRADYLLELDERHTIVAADFRA